MLLIFMNALICLGWQDPEYRKCYTDIFNGDWEVCVNIQCRPIPVIYLFVKSIET